MFLSAMKKIFFLEQALLSITSLHIKIQNADITVLVDDITANTSINARVEIYNIANLRCLICLYAVVLTKTAYNNDMMISAFSENTCLCHHKERCFPTY
jgi:hypothetical protein